MFRDVQRVNTRGYKRQTKARTWSSVSSRTPFRTRNSRGTKRITLESFTVKERIRGKETDRTRDARREKKEGRRTKTDKTSLWIPAAYRAGRPHCPKCPARYEIMSARAHEHAETRG